MFVTPGGKDWILLTKGTDITESFETSHVFGVPRALLKKFWVKKAEKPRTARFTFDEDGFYKKVQRRGAAILRKVGTGPTFFSTLTIDLLVITYLVLFCLLCAYPSMSLALTAGMVSIICLNGHLLYHINVWSPFPSCVPGHGSCQCSQLVPPGGQD